jgi:hypothetical protein
MKGRVTQSVGLGQGVTLKIAERQLAAPPDPLQHLVTRSDTGVLGQVGIEPQDIVEQRLLAEFQVGDHFVLDTRHATPLALGLDLAPGLLAVKISGRFDFVQFFAAVAESDPHIEGGRNHPITEFDLDPQGVFAEHVHLRIAFQQTSGSIQAGNKG